MSFTYHKDYKRELHSESICIGKLCPQCLKPDTEVEIECTGSNPDGRYCNFGYDCHGCGAQWEGY